MAGKIIADQIEHSTAGSLDTQYVVNGSAKAWANLNGSTFGLRKSVNIASAVDNGTGDYTLSFTSVMADINYASNGTTSNDVSLSPQTIAVNNKSAGGYANVAPTTSQFRMSVVRASDGAVADGLYVSTSNHGDLA